MKKTLLIILSIFFIYVGISNVFAQNNHKKGEIMDTKDKKVLIAYFSWSGNTKYIAEKIHAQIGGDIFRIETLEPYPENYNETAYGVAKEQHDKNIHPELKSNGDVSKYDIIFVGTPAWWYTMAPAVMTFLENNDFSGKVIVPFITHGGGGKYTIAEDMGKLAKNADILTPFVVYEGGNSKTDNEISEWLKKLQ